MKITVVGLGNPGIRYDRSYHNVGFMAVDLLAQELNFPEFSRKKNFDISKRGDFTLVKPITFMNLSGIAVKNALVKDSSLIVVHDDIDIPLGEIKISQSRGAAGHRGVTSVIRELGTKDFTRVRIGIRPEKKPSALDLFVLRKPTKEEEPLLLQGIDRALSFLKEKAE